MTTPTSSEIDAQVAQVTLELVDGDYHAKVAIDSQMVQEPYLADAGSTALRLLTRNIKMQKQREKDLTDG